MAVAGTILVNYSGLSICQMFLFLEILLELCFLSIFLICVKEKEQWAGFLQRNCLLIQIQNELRCYKRQKNFKFWTKNDIFGYFLYILSLKLTETTIFHISIFQFIKIWSVIQKEKTLNLRVKNTLFRDFWDAIFQKSYYLKQSPQILHDARFYFLKKFFLV